jgi:hypothetical protein
MRPAHALDIVATVASAAVAVTVATACGRIGFDPAAGGGDAHGDGMGPELACGETRSAGAATLAGSAFEAVVTARGLAAFWIDAGGVLRGTTWSIDERGGIASQEPVEIAAGPFTQLRVAANGDEILIATQAGATITTHFLQGDLTQLRPSGDLGGGSLDGREPLAARRGGPGFVAIKTDGTQTAIYEVDGVNPPVPHPLAALAAHTAASIAADTGDYAVVTEHADQSGTGCWYSSVDDAFAITSDPRALEFQASSDCDSVILSATPTSQGVGIIWLQPGSTITYLGRKTTRAIASINLQGTSDPGMALPVPALTSVPPGFTLIYRSAAGLRTHSNGSFLTITPSFGFADLVTWADRAIVVWTTSAGAPQLTRLCPERSD